MFSKVFSMFSTVFLGFSDVFFFFPPRVCSNFFSRVF